MRILVHGLRQLAVAGESLSLRSRNSTTHRRCEQDARLAQRIKRAVIQDHARTMFTRRSPAGRFRLARETSLLIGYWGAEGRHGVTV